MEFFSPANLLRQWLRIKLKSYLNTIVMEKKLPCCPSVSTSVMLKNKNFRLHSTQILPSMEEAKTTISTSW
jgi:hypothetical protein